MKQTATLRKTSLGCQWACNVSQSVQVSWFVSDSGHQAELYGKIQIFWHVNPSEEPDF